MCSNSTGTLMDTGINTSSPFSILTNMSSIYLMLHDRNQSGKLTFNFTEHSIHGVSSVAEFVKLM